MCNKEIVKYFFEVIVSQHKLEELPAGGEKGGLCLEGREGDGCVCVTHLRRKI